MSNTWKFESVSEIVEFYKNHLIVVALIHTHFNEHGRLVVSNHLSSVTGLGFDATELSRNLIDHNWAIESFNLKHVGTYTIEAIFEHERNEYSIVGFEIVAKVH